MKIYSNIATAAFTLFGYAATSAYQVYHAAVPIQFMHGCQFKDMLMGLIYSEVNEVGPPQGELRTLFDFQLAALAENYGNLAKLHKFPVFERQNELLQSLELSSAHGLTLGRNEAFMRKTFTGKAPRLDTIFDVVNREHTLLSMLTIDSYDLSKLSGDVIVHRQGYPFEQYSLQGQQFSLHKLPLLSANNQAFGCQFCDFNAAKVDQHTKKMLTVMFGFGLTVDHFNGFAKHLQALQHTQEQEGASTLRMQIISGYPAIYEYTDQQTPNIVIGP